VLAAVAVIGALVLTGTGVALRWWNTAGPGAVVGPAVVAAAVAASPDSAQVSDAANAASGVDSTLPTLVSTAVRVQGKITARAYFGRLDEMLDNLDGRVTFNVRSAVSQAYAERCVLTVVYSGVHGSSARAYSYGQDGRWSAIEDEPGAKVATDHGRIHHQLISPPVSARIGRSWNLSSAILIGKNATRSSDYTLTLTSVGGASPIWSFAGSPVSCGPG